AYGADHIGPGEIHNFPTRGSSRFFSDAPGGEAPVHGPGICKKRAAGNSNAVPMDQGRTSSPLSGVNILERLDFSLRRRRHSTNPPYQST
ncbi:MAG: hypothetical protein OXQ92_04475, partial [Boseongicola sp.]|nr:hypothetical protein [Boseongicola sp.]